MSRPARILMVAPRFWPATGGIERHVDALVGGLAGRGLAVTVATTDPTGTLARIELKNGVMIRRFPTLGRDDVYYLAPGLAAWLVLQAGHYDLIHAHSYHTPIALVAAFAARMHRVPFVATPHYHGTGHTARRARLHRPYRPLGGWMLRRADKVICCSIAERDLIVADFGALPTTVIPHGVDIDAIDQAEPYTVAADRVIVSGGRLELYKQVDRVVDAMCDLPETWRLVIFGDGPARDDLERRARQAKLGDRVSFVGRVSDEDLRRWYRTADVFVSMSRHEAFGLTVLEGAASGASVVCSDIPAYLEIAGWIPSERITTVGVDSAPPIVAAAIASAVEQRSRMPRPAWAPPSWETMVSKTLDVYRASLVSPRRLAGRLSP